MQGLLGDTGESGTHVATVFGLCRRCGSARLLVTTRQLRRADEGQSGVHLRSQGVPPVADRDTLLSRLWTRH